MITYTQSPNDDSINCCVDGIYTNIPLHHRLYQDILVQVNLGIAEILPYVEPDITIDAVRAKRNVLLQETDKYALVDSVIPYGLTQQQILNYRQALRDMTENLDLTGVKSIDQIIFPTNPIE